MRSSVVCENMHHSARNAYLALEGNGSLCKESQRVEFLMQISDMDNVLVSCMLMHACIICLKLNIFMLVRWL